MPRKYVKKNLKKKYSNYERQLAIESVTRGASIREASNTHHIPYTTLNSHVNNEVLYNQAGRPTKFSTEEENCLEDAALALQNWGVPVTIEEFLNIAQQYASSLEKSHLFPLGKPTYDWLRSFLKRHPNLKLKKSRPLEKKRAAVTDEQINEWFKLLSTVIMKNDLANAPAQLFNCDESGLSDCISYSKVIVHRQTSDAYRVQGGTGGKSFTSVMFCASATGFLLPPFVVYKSKRLYQEWCSGGPPGTGYGNSENGWMEKMLFYNWFEKIFLKHTENLPRPLVLILDGHGSHFMVETLKLAVTHKVIIVCLPSNSTHLLQPLDIVFFNPLKIKWKKILKAEYNRTCNKNIPKARFPSLLKQLWDCDDMKNKTNIVKSFMKAGIFPLNPTAIPRSRLIRNSSSTDPSYSNATTVNDSAQDQSPSNEIDVSSNPGDNDCDRYQDTTLVSSSRHKYTSFTTSRDAIDVLDQVIETSVVSDTIDQHDSDDDDDSNENYTPAMLDDSINRKSSRKRKYESIHESTIAVNNKIGSKSLNLNIPNDKAEILIDDLSDESHSPTTSIRTAPLAENNLTTKRTQLIKSTKTHDYKRAKPINIELSTSEDEDNEIDRTQKSIQAITDTLKAVFSTTPQQTKNQSKRRTLIQHTTGQVMTEDEIIQQLEEKQKALREKQSRTSNRKSNGRKRR